MIEFLFIILSIFIGGLPIILEIIGHAVPLNPFVFGVLMSMIIGIECYEWMNVPLYTSIWLALAAGMIAFLYVKWRREKGAKDDL